MPWKKNEPMEQRIEFGLKAMRTLNFRALCQEYGVSAKTGYKWKERFLREGIRGMGEESRRPKSSPEQLGEEKVCEIVALEAGARFLGAAQDPRAVFAPARGGGQRKHFQTSVGTSRANAKAASAPLD
jgi:hypothetical protein